MALAPDPLHLVGVARDGPPTLPKKREVERMEEDVQGKLLQYWMERLDHRLTGTLLSIQNSEEFRARWEGLKPLLAHKLVQRQIAPEGIDVGLFFEHVVALVIYWTKKHVGIAPSDSEMEAVINTANIALAGLLDDENFMNAFRSDLMENVIFRLIPPIGYKPPAFSSGTSRLSRVSRGDRKGR
ncbi:MAG: hypothetical protein M1153_00510 [Patescibacteria group bacterium]|nr:hypothetical protein [Patescibacteria group bacterium]